eukprot:gene14269-16843_t
MSLSTLSRSIGIPRGYATSTVADDAKRADLVPQENESAERVAKILKSFTNHTLASRIEHTVKKAAERGPLPIVEKTRGRFDLKIDAKQSDIIVFYNEKHNAIELGIVHSVIGNNYGVLLRSKKHVVARNHHILTFPTSDDDGLEAMVGSISEIAQSLDIMLSRANDKLLAEWASNQVMPDTDIDKMEHAMQHRHRVTLWHIESFCKDLKRLYRLDREALYERFRAPFTGHSFVDKKPWSRDQNHFDRVPVVEAAKFYFDNKDPAKISNCKNPFTDLFHLLITYQGLVWNSSHFILHDSTHFSCLSHARMERLENIKANLLFGREPKDVVLKYIVFLIRKLNPEVKMFKSQMDIINDEKVPIILDHHNFIVDKTGKPYPRIEQIKKAYRLVLDALKEYQSYSAQSEMGYFIYDKLVAPTGMKRHLFQVIALLEQNLKPSVPYVYIEDKIRTHSNYTLGDSPFLAKEIRTLGIANNRKTPSMQLITEDSFTIDKPTTKDVDDAIGILREGDDTYCVVHISDVSRVIDPYSNLDAWGQFKASSLYFPLKVHPMLPHDVTAYLSLEPNKTNQCLSFKFKITDDGEITDYEIFTSTVKNIRKTNYDEVNAYLDMGDRSLNTSYTPHQQKALDQLYEFAKRRHDKRRINSFTVELPKAEVYVDNAGHISLHHQDLDSKSNLIVSEMMVSANHVAAKYAATNSLPIPFRHQATCDFADYPFDLEDLLHPISKGFEATKHIVQAKLDVVNSNHFGLGIDHYTWASSPIRRYSDILVHRQIKKFLETKEPLYSQEYLQQLMDPLNAQVSSLKRTQRSSLTSWLFKYIQQEQSKYHDAVVISNPTDPEVTRVLLLETGLMVNLKDKIDMTPEVIKVYCTVTPGLIPSFTMQPVPDKGTIRL